MRYNTLFNIPDERRRITYPFVWWDNGLKPEELQAIHDYCVERGVDEATVIGGNKDNVRRSGVRFHNHCQELGWFFERLNYIIKSLNDQYYGFDLNGYDAFQFTEYQPDGEYFWHMDTTLGGKEECLPDSMQEPRKLSMSLLLNEQGKDFEGGDLQFNLGREENARTAATPRGRAVCFPSWLCHRVTPVTSGVRRSVVVWVTGPKFK